MRHKVLSTQHLPLHLRERLEEYAEVIYEDELEGRGSEYLGEVDAVLCIRINPELLRSMSNLRMIQCITAGIDHLPWEHIREDVVVCSNAGSNANAVAEHAFALLLAAAKRVTLHDYKIRTSGSSRGWPESVQLKGDSLCVLGLGEVGRRIAEIAKCFNMRVFGYSRRPKLDVSIDRFYNEGELDDALSSSRFVVIALALTRKTRGIINYARLSKMRGDGVLVNIARADIVVKEDVKRFLSENPDFTYASDVWWSYPELSKDLDVISMPNVIATPWTAGAYGSSVVYEAMLKEAVDNLIRYLRGEEPRNVASHEDYK